MRVKEIQGKDGTVWRQPPGDVQQVTKRKERPSHGQPYSTSKVKTGQEWKIFRIGLPWFILGKGVTADLSRRDLPSSAQESNTQPTGQIKARREKMNVYN